MEQTENQYVHDDCMALDDDEFYEEVYDAERCYEDRVRPKPNSSVRP